MPVMDSTCSGVYFLTVSLSASKFSVRSSMKVLSWRPSLMITFIMPLSQAMSVPGFWRSQTVANLARSILLGSTRMSLAPFWVTARFTKVEITG